jgi:hypothetical protein
MQHAVATALLELLSYNDGDPAMATNTANLQQCNNGEEMKPATEFERLLMNRNLIG